jgi:non-specific serine/threonine protein kinase/serine/threonine-protein kinase PknK
LDRPALGDASRSAEIGGPSSIDLGVDLGLDGLSEVRMVGSGGSSTVYAARQLALDRTVAVKVVHAAWSIETRERFEHEREVMGRLSGHTAIVPILQTGITARGEPYLLMPLYERGSLFRLVRERGPLPWRDAVFLIEPVIQTLADCHRDGIVHRDVKPGNVLLTRHLHPRLTDFGIALPVGMATSPSTVAFTPFYSPPEAYGPGLAMPTVDVHAVAATLWVLLTGAAPDVAVPDRRDTSGPTAADLDAPTWWADLRDRSHHDLPPAIAEVIRRATEPDPANRPADAAELLAELRRAIRMADEPEGPARPKRSPDRPDRPDPRPGDRRRLSGATVAAVGAVVIGVALVLWALSGLR